MDPRKPSSMATVLYVFCLLFSVLVLSAGIMAHSQTSGFEQIRLCIAGDRIAVRAAQANGIYAKYGLQVDAAQMPSSDAQRADLKAGRIDIAQSAADNAVAAVEQVGIDAIIVMGGGGSLDELVAQPDYKSVKDLRGTTLIVDAPNTAMALMMRRTLVLNGVNPDRDCEIKPSATGAQRFALVRESKAYAAAMMAPPNSIVAKREGFVSLGSASEIIGPMHNSSVFVRRKWAQEHTELLVRFIMASIEAQRWIILPANKLPVINLIAQENKTPFDVASQTYELEVNSPGRWNKDARFSVDNFKNVLKLRQDIEGTWGTKAATTGQVLRSHLLRTSARKDKGLGSILIRAFLGTC